MLPSDMTTRERAEWPLGRCGRCGIKITSTNEWLGDDYGWDLICASCARSVRESNRPIDVDESIADHVHLAVRYAANHWPRPKARAWRRAFALGYFQNAMLAKSPLHNHIDEDRFVQRVDLAAYAYLTGRKSHAARPASTANVSEPEK